MSLNRKESNKLKRWRRSRESEFKKVKRRSLNGEPESKKCESRSKSRESESIGNSQSASLVVILCRYFKNASQFKDSAVT